MARWGVVMSPFPIIFAYQGPVGFTGVHLRTGAAVDGQCLDAAILQLLGKFHDDFMVLVPSQTGFYRDRNLYRIHYGTGDFQHLGDILKHACSCPLACHPLYRASEVQVENVGAGLFYDTRRFYHGFGIFPVDLDGNRTFGGTDVEFHHRLVYRAYQGVARYEFGIDHIGSEFLAKQAERRVGHVFHGGQHHGSFS